jgi:hypothetical protein
MREDTTLAGERDLPDTVRRIRERVQGLIAGCDADELTQKVGASPDFSVLEICSHLTGVVVDAANGDAPQYPLIGSDDRVRLHVTQSGADDVDEILAAWQAAEPKLVENSSDEQLINVIVELTTREHDLRAQLDEPGHRDDVAMKIALDALSAAFSDRVKAAGAPPLRVTVEQWGTIIGDDGRSRECLVGDRYEFVRAMTGRRSRAQLDRWSWSTDASPYVSTLSATGSLRDSDFRERDPRVPEHMRDFDLTH